MKKILFASALFLTALSVGSAQTIVVLKPTDTVSGITTFTDTTTWDLITSGSTFADFGSASTTPNTANLAGQVYRGDPGDNTLTTTISGLDNGTQYNVYVFFGARTDANWGIKAGPNAGSLTTYLGNDGTNLQTVTGTLKFNYVTIVSSATPTAGQLSIAVAPVTLGASPRALYKGIGVEAVSVPEPAAYALIMTGALGLLALVRRRYIG